MLAKMTTAFYIYDVSVSMNECWIKLIDTIVIQSAPNGTCGSIVTGLPSGPIAQWSKYSYGLRGVQGSRPGRVMCFFLPCDTNMISGSQDTCMLRWVIFIYKVLSFFFVQYMFFSCLTVELTRLCPNLPVENVFIFKKFTPIGA